MVPNGSSLITNNPKSKSAGLQFARITLFVIALLFISLPMASAGSGVDINAETFPDAAFRAIVSADYSDGSGHVDMSVTSITVNSQSIASLAGIEYFPALTDLACNNNQLTALDVSQNTALSTLGCANNNLSRLDLSSNSALTIVYCIYNNLTALNTSHNPLLTYLACTNNNINSLDVSANLLLETLACSDNNLSVLDLSNNLALDNLSCSNNFLSSLDVSQNPEIISLFCSSNQLTSLDVTGLSKLGRLYCNSNPLNSLDLSHNPLLSFLNCSDNELTELDVSNNSKLCAIDCHANQLETLDVSHNLSLTGLVCHHNKLASIDLHNNSRYLCDDPSFGPESLSPQYPDPLPCIQSGGKYYVNLLALPYGYLIDLDSVSMCDGGVLNTETGIICYDTMPGNVSYAYTTHTATDYCPAPVIGTAEMQVTLPVQAGNADTVYNPYAITAKAASNGSLSCNVSSAMPGSIISVTATPDDGYQQKEGSLTVNGTVIQGTIFTMPSQNVTVACDFEPVPAQDDTDTSIVYAGYVDLKYQFKVSLLSWFRDESVPPIPKNVNKASTDSDYAQELLAWADALGYDFSGLDAEALLDIPFAMPYMTTNDEIVFEVSQTQTVKDVMADIIMLGTLQNYVISEETVAVESEGAKQVLNDSTKRMLEYLNRYNTYIDEKPTVKYDPRTIASGLSVIKRIIDSTWLENLDTSLVNSFADVVISTNPDYDSVISALDSVKTDQELLAAQNGILETVGFGLDVYKLVEAFKPGDETWTLSSWNTKLSSTDFIYDIVAEKFQDTNNPSAYILWEVGKGCYDFLKLAEKTFGPVTMSVNLFEKYLQFAVYCIHYIEDQYPSWLFYTHYYVMANYPQYFSQIGFDENGVFDMVSTHVNITGAKADCDALAYNLLSGTVWSYANNYRLYGSQADLSDSERRTLISYAATLAEVRCTNYRDVQKCLLEYILAQVNTTEEPAALSANCPVEVQLIDEDGNVVFRLNTDDAYTQNYTGYCTFYLSGDDRDQKNLIISGDYDIRILPLANGTMSLSINPPDGSNITYAFNDIPIAVGEIYLLTYQGDQPPVLQKISTSGATAILAPDSVTVMANQLVLSDRYLELTKTATYTLSCEIDPPSLTGVTLNWTSSDPDIASVDSTGLVTAVSPGNVVITVSYGTAFDLCKVTVLPREQDLVTLTFSTSAGGTISGDFEDQYSIGSALSFIAEADDGYAFVQWEVSDANLIDDLQSCVTSITVPASSQTITASFEPIRTYYLTVQDCEYGTVFMNPSGYYEAGESIVLNILPDQDYYFGSWVSSDGGSFEDAASTSTVFTMPANDTTLTASFSPYDDLIPQTGDTHRFPWYVILMLGTLLCIVLLFVQKRNAQNANYH